MLVCTGQLKLVLSSWTRELTSYIIKYFVSHGVSLFTLVTQPSRHSPNLHPRGSQTIAGILTLETKEYNFGTVVGENPTPYGILALWAVIGLSIVCWDGILPMLGYYSQNISPVSSEKKFQHEGTT